MTRILTVTTWIVCLTCVGLSAAEAAPGADGMSLRVNPGAWHQATSSAPVRGQLRPGFRHLRLSVSNPSSTQQTQVSDAAIKRLGELGVLRQSQSAPPPQAQGFLTPGSPSFYLFILDISMLVGSLAVQIGSNIAANMGADLTGWKVAGLVLDGIGLATAIGMIATIDMSQLPSFFPIIIYISLGLSALSFLWGGIQLILYINRRNKIREMRERRERDGTTPDNGQPPQPQKNPTVLMLPWGGVDQDGNPVGGLAMVGRF